MSKKFSLSANRKIILNDLILILSILIVLGLALFVFKATRKEGNRVVVAVDGQKIAEYSIDSNINELIETENGNNTLEIRDKTVYISQADCPDKICENHRPISKIGESIVCLPHKLVITIEGNDMTNSLDAEI